MKQQLFTYLTAFLFVTFVPPVSAQTLIQSDAETSEEIQTLFGGSAVVSGDEIIVGSTYETTATGELHVYRKEGGAWKEAARISASDGVEDNRFGRSLALNGSTLLVGATLQDGPSGAAYIFQKNADGTWIEQAKLVPAEVADSYGRAVALNDNFAFISTVSKDENRGVVYVFQRDGEEGWREHSMLQPEELEPDDWFGVSLSVFEDRLIVGAPAYEREDFGGSAYVFGYDSASGMWKQEDRMVADEADPGSRFGHAALLYEDFAVIGAFSHNRGAGKVYIYSRDGESGQWEETNQLVAFDGGQGTQFGYSLGVNDESLWVGAIGASNGVGAVYTFDFDFSTNTWSGVNKLHAGEEKLRSGFGARIASSGDLALIGAPYADNNLGTAHVFERNDEGAWSETAVLLLEETGGMDPVLGERVVCQEGKASLFGCEKVDLLSFVPIKDLEAGRGLELSDIWGWTDPETGDEYALVTRSNGTSFVRITDPYNPVVVGNLPLTKGAVPNSWRDVKVYKDHAFVVADNAGDHGMQVFDLTQLRDIDAADGPVAFEETALYDELASVHNIVINESTGYAFAVGSNSGGQTCGGGLHMINIQDPVNPTFAGCFADTETGRSGTGYTHDAQCVIYNGPDTDHQGREICFGSNETALSIADVTDKENPVALSSAAYPNVAYAHQGWLTEDQKFFYMNDELDETSGNVSNTRTMIWDVQDLDDPQLVKEFFLETTSTDHNLYIRGNLMYQANYNAGLRIFDISDVENPVSVGHFDTTPFGSDGPGFDGAWSNYPYFESGVIAVSSIGQGLFLVRKSDVDI